MYPNSTARISSDRFDPDLASVKARWTAANERPSVSTLLAVASDTAGLIVNVQKLTRDKNRLLTAAQAVIDALHDGRPGPVSDLAALLVELSSSPELVSP